ncbi:MAG: DUF2934 domain-containing protein [Thermodesulfobacteriota bacterium]
MTLRKRNITRKSKSADQAGAVISKAVEKLREDRQQMIATAAYYRAEKRGFNSSDEIQDWLEAEAEIDGNSYN